MRGSMRDVEMLAAILPGSKERLSREQVQIRAS